MPRELSLAEIFQLGYYWETKILLTAIKLDLFSALDSRSSSSSELANRLTLNDRSLSLLLNALVAMRVHLIVSHENRRRLQALVQFLDFLAHLHAQLRI